MRTARSTSRTSRGACSAQVSRPRRDTRVKVSPDQKAGCQFGETCGRVQVRGRESCAQRGELRTARWTLRTTQEEFSSAGVGDGGVVDDPGRRPTAAAVGIADVEEDRAEAFHLLSPGELGCEAVGGGQLLHSSSGVVVDASVAGEGHAEGPPSRLDFRSEEVLALGVGANDEDGGVFFRAVRFAVELNEHAWVERLGFAHAADGEESSFPLIGRRVDGCAKSERRPGSLFPFLPRRNVDPDDRRGVEADRNDAGLLSGVEDQVVLLVAARFGVGNSAVERAHQQCALAARQSACRRFDALDVVGLSPFHALGPEAVLRASRRLTPLLVDVVAAFGPVVDELPFRVLKIILDGFGLRPACLGTEQEAGRRQQPGGPSHSREGNALIHFLMSPKSCGSVVFDDPSRAETDRL